MGLKVGIYSDATEFGPSPVDDVTSTRGNYEGSSGYEETADAATFCETGSQVRQPARYDRSKSRTEERYRFVWNTHLAQDRAIQYSLCVWDHAHAEARGNETGHSWRIEPEPTLRSRRRSRSPLIIRDAARGGLRLKVLAILANRELVRFSNGAVFGAAARAVQVGRRPSRVPRAAFVDVPGLAAAHSARHVDVGIFDDEYTVELTGHNTAALRIDEVRCVKRPART
ncbi:hypothetical protein LZ31DRAFT_594463 [Colletotrichum somersetense]|nr:hypothetical protein LZ31DRAFT_594463 [Colletotrichum somersetense]